MISVSSSSVSLPNELTEQIISLLWLSPLTILERTRLIKSSVEMSGLWHIIFTRVVSKDFYIIGPYHASIFLDLLRGKRETSADNPLDLTALCRSITIQHEGDRLLPAPDELQPIAFIFRYILRELSNVKSPVQLPFLRRVSLELQDYLMETVFDANSYLFTCLPNQMTELEIKFTYSEKTKPSQIQGVKMWLLDRFGLKKAQITGLKRVTVLGASRGSTIELLRVFGGPGRIEFKQDAWGESVKPELLIDKKEFFDYEKPLQPMLKSRWTEFVDHSNSWSFSNHETDGYWMI
ncbi:hypothetical protein V5O48_016750 [Marasmius crinis-equi]|uniref:F-box domain-containing protein n=1 Tax=Marasmius crinis-equi TaxID=585013 RepID=A0ABR3EQW2_9AGAR